MKHVSTTSTLAVLTTASLSSSQASPSKDVSFLKAGIRGAATKSSFGPFPSSWRAAGSDEQKIITGDTEVARIPWVTCIPRGGGREKNDDDSNESSKVDNKKNNSQSDKGKPNKKKKTTKSSSDYTPSSNHTASKNEKANSDNNTKGKKSTQTRVAPIVEEILKHEDFYAILGVGTTASDRDITKAYRRRCVQTHPDKTNGDRRAFDKVSEAYDVLSDAPKRQMYDRFGKSGLSNNANGATAAGSYQDVFRSMFQQAAQQRRQQQQRNASLRYQLQVTLEDLYHGRTHRISITPPESYHHRHNTNHRKQKQVDVHIPKGSINGQTIVLSGEVDFNDDTTPGDLVFVLTQAIHPTFTRKGHDLAMDLSIGLDEALCGYQRLIRHLSGEELWIESAKTPQGRPVAIQTGDVQVLKGWGMPKRNQSGEFGDLYIQYRVEMPDGKNSAMLTDDELQELSRLLGKLQNTNKRMSKLRESKALSMKNGSICSDSVGKVDIHSLLEASTSDFGTASGNVVWEEEEDGNDTSHPFASSFFGGSRGSSSFYFGNFAGANPFDEDDGNVQCQQM